ncbi:GAF domain-containing sensor histidine kinase [Rickettsiales bacterium]|nr:GAF domain-containing sensor histidine kinase [Rickettsiales bacterium]
MSSNQNNILIQNIITKINQDDKISLLCKIDKDSPYFIEIIHPNNQFIKHFGYDAKNIVGENFDIILDNDNDDLETIVEYNNLVKKISKTSSLNFSLNICNRDNHSEKFAINFKSKVSNDTKYCVFYFSSNITDSVSNQSRAESSGQKNLVHNLERVLRNEKLLRISSDLMLKDESISEISYKALNVLSNYFKIDRAILCQFNNQDVSLICEFCNEHTSSIVNCSDLEDQSKYLKKYLDFHNNVFSGFFKSPKTENMIIESIIHDSAFNDIEDVCRKFNISSQFCLSSPINEDFNIGLFLHQTNIKKWNSEEVEIINTIANQLSVAIQKSIYLDQIMESNRELLKKSIALKNSLNEEKKMRMVQNEFIAMASHEFKTPLQIIDSSRELLGRKLKNNKLTLESGESNLSKIKNAITRLHSLISSTLDLSQIAMSSGDLDLNLENISLQDLLLGIIKQNEEVYSKKNAKIKIDIAKLPDQYRADHKMLDHCFTNIIGNAVKYSPENSTIKILGGQIEDKIIIKIVDNGIGIPKADLKNIGEKFYRAKNTLKISGTGIGLYLTKYFIKLHKGEVLIQSVEGKGTELTVVLPNKNAK